MNRRQLIRTLSLATAAGAFIPLDALANAWQKPQSSSVRFWFGVRRFPLLTAGESVTVSERVRKIETFEPLFGPERAAVNPSRPGVRHSKELVFHVPGEYYLRVNGAPLKVLVFAAHEPISSSLLRVFDFLVANNLYLNAQDLVWYDYRNSFLDRFFTSDEPMMVTCGPMHQLFRVLVNRRFCLPTRFTTSASRFYQQGGILSLSHNVPEIYAPDLGKWVFFDLNNGVVPLWMDALELAQATRVWGDHAVQSEDIGDLEVAIHADVDQCIPSQKAFQLVEQLGDGGLLEFSGELVSVPVEGGNRARGLRSFYGGTGYYGQNVKNAGATGTEFLRGTFQFVDLQTNEELRREQRKALPPDTEYVDIEEMRNRLAAGAHTQIEKAEWISRFPFNSSVTSLERTKHVGSAD